MRTAVIGYWPKDKPYHDTDWLRSGGTVPHYRRITTREHPTADDRLQVIVQIASIEEAEQIDPALALDNLLGS